MTSDQPKLYFRHYIFLSLSRLFYFSGILLSCLKIFFTTVMFMVIFYYLYYQYNLFLMMLLVAQSEASCFLRVYPLYFGILFLFATILLMEDYSRLPVFGLWCLFKAGFSHLTSLSFPSIMQNTFFYKKYIKIFLTYFWNWLTYWSIFLFAFGLA